MTLLKTRKILGIILALSFLFSLGYSFFYKIPPLVDAQAYDQIAVNLIAGFGFKEDRNTSYKFDTSIVRAGPAYELFLAGVYKVFGHHYEVVWILQALLHALSAYILFLICREVFKDGGDRIGLIAAALFGWHPDLIEISAMLMTETLYLFLVIAVVWVFVKLYRQSAKLFYTVLLSLLTALAILSRPPVALFVPIILIFYFWQRKYKFAVLFLILLTLWLAPWTIRNYLIYRQFIPTTLIGEYNLWVGNTLISNGGQIFGGFNPATAYAEKFGYFSFKHEAQQQFKSFVSQHPFTFIKLSAVRFIRYFSLIRPMGFWFYQTGLGQIIFVLTSLLAIAVLFISGFSGLVLALKQKNQLFNYLAVLAILAPLVLIPTVVQSRYRFQIYPFLAIFGAYFLTAWLNKNEHCLMAIKVVGLSLFFVSLLDSLLFWPTVQDKLLMLFKYV